jgi:hypothetical protein
MSTVSSGGNSAKHSSSEPHPSSHGTVAWLSNRTPGLIVAPRPDRASDGAASGLRSTVSGARPPFRGACFTLAIRTWRNTIRGAPGAAAVSIGFMAISFGRAIIARRKSAVKNKTRTLVDGGVLAGSICLPTMRIQGCRNHHENVACRLKTSWMTELFKPASKRFPAH